MKVKELIKALKAFDQEAEVLTKDAEWGYLPISKPKAETNVSVKNHFTNKPATVIKKAVVL